jgi:protein O-GlcNAc transferase
VNTKRSLQAEPTRQQVDELLSKFNKKEFKNAQDLATRLTKSFPNHPFAWMVLGAIHRHLGDMGDAEKFLVKSVSLSPNDPIPIYNLANVLKDLGRLTEAQRNYREAIRLQPDFSEAYLNLGVTLHDLRLLTAAEGSYLDAIRLKPDFAEAHYNLGNVLRQTGRASEAEARYREAIRIKSDYTEAHLNLGSVLLDAKRFAEAEACFKEVINYAPDYAHAYNNLGNTLQALGRKTEAEASYREAIRRKPDYAEAFYNLGNIAKSFGRLTEAQLAYMEAIRCKPDYSEAHNNLGVTLRELGKLTEAESSYRDAIRIDPEYAEAHSNLGNALHNLGCFAQAEESYREAIRLRPEYAEAHSNLGNVLRDLGRATESEANYREAIRLKPDYAEAYNNLGNVLTDFARFSEAEVNYRLAIRLKPDSIQVYSNLLFSLSYVESLPPETALIEAQHYGALVSSRAEPKFRSWQADTQALKLKVGFVSGDFNNHPVGYFIEGLIKHLDQLRFEVYVFPTTPKKDDLTDRLKPLVSKWIPVYGNTDRNAASLIHDQGIHILVDMAGHTAHNRLPIFAYKPAPIQVSWLGYFATTGLPEIDYLLGDAHVTPNDEAHHFSERLWQLPETYLCFTPPIEDIAIGPLPALTNGYITLGSFNNLTKISTSVVALWSRILHSIPTAKLFLKTKQLADAAGRNRIIHQFSGFDIPEDRLLLEGPASRGHLLAAYNKVDIALDPFPYPGGTTSAEAMWMGVPVLTIKGNRFLSHVGETIAHNSGQSDWIAHDPDDYVRKAVAYAADLQQLTTLRRDLRNKVLQSPLFDAQRFAKHFEQALQKIWVDRQK